MQAESKYIFAEIISRLGGEDRGMLTGNFGPRDNNISFPCCCCCSERENICMQDMAGAAYY